MFIGLLLVIFGIAYYFDKGRSVLLRGITGSSLIITGALSMIIEELDVVSPIISVLYLFFILLVPTLIIVGMFKKK
ncbi:hypothetical protein SAMN02745227_00229 [Anaerobranca californiensis DSM 14826]|uniref:Uncharacterized protein n=1 Tax=Anaerobranca californiensis DSM 14826 TaxID=1120989 RepID=A0A1M6KRU2_9FIRM|nr:hypothetical protein [Anaerobranca californiensis]SHJ61658.1 hypothetical protein SAMN02745227_00229 [Anaerobranca californiensis DSM 14826]